MKKQNTKIHELKQHLIKMAENGEAPREGINVALMMLRDIEPSNSGRPGKGEKK